MLVAVAILTTACGGILGAATNAVNGAVSPEYYVAVLGWHHVQDVARAAIAQGIFEGLIYAGGFALVYALVLGIATKAAAPFGFAVRKVAFAALVALACWVLGGVVAVGLASLSPDFYRHTFFGVPDDFGGMLRYAWVGGSIWGILFGGALALIVTPLRAVAEWRRRPTAPGLPEDAATPATPAVPPDAG